jgi:hypothetical protein
MRLLGSGARPMAAAKPSRSWGEGGAQRRVRKLSKNLGEKNKILGVCNADRVFRKQDGARGEGQKIPDHVCNLQKLNNLPKNEAKRT